MSHLRLLSKFVLLNACISLFCNTVWAVSLSGSSNCPASKEYLSDLARYTSNNKTEQDYSCLTDLPSINTSLSQYQLIDTDSKAALAADVWKMSIDELKLKHYLHDRKLLLLGNKFSRVEAASYCSILKKNGFNRIKILIGGAQLWRQYKEKDTYKPSDVTVTAKDFMYEYFNGSVQVVAANQSIYQRLTRLGIEKPTLFQSNTALSDFILNESSGGYIPVVFVGDIKESDSLQNRYPNFFILNGGIAALENQFKTDVMTDASRFDTLEVSACASRNL